MRVVWSQGGCGYIHQKIIKLSGNFGGIKRFQCFCPVIVEQQKSMISLFRF